MHFNDLKRDLDAKMHRIARFLDIDLPEQPWPAVIGRCTFDNMRENEAMVGDMSRGHQRPLARRAHRREARPSRTGSPALLETTNGRHKSDVQRLKRRNQSRRVCTPAIRMVDVQFDAIAVRVIQI